MRYTPPIRLALFLFIAGCVKPDPQPRFTPAWEPFDPDKGNWLTSRTVLVVADCQIHNLYSQALPDRNLSVEAVATTAIRPPQLDLFADEVLEWILKHGAPEAEVVLHLGDALDIGCESEFRTFLQTMKNTGKPWFMAPGNHDFYYLGSYDPQDLELWQSACYPSGETLPKDRFIRLYVEALLGQDDPGCTALAGALFAGGDTTSSSSSSSIASRLPQEFEWQAGEETPGFLKAIGTPRPELKDAVDEMMAVIREKRSRSEAPEL